MKKPLYDLTPKGRLIKAEKRRKHARKARKAKGRRIHYRQFNRGEAGIRAYRQQAAFAHVRQEAAKKPKQTQSSNQSAWQNLKNQAGIFFRRLTAK